MLPAHRDGISARARNLPAIYVIFVGGWWRDGRTAGFDVSLRGSWGKMEDLVWGRVAVGWEGERMGCG